MVFITRFTLADRTPPVRAYVHKAGLKEAYSTTLPQLFQEEKNRVRNYLIEVLDKNQEEYSKYRYLLAALWGQINPSDQTKAAKVIDFSGFSGIDDEKWPGNPDVFSWVVKDGVCIPTNQITCGDTLIALGVEEQLRRRTKNLADYIAESDENNFYIYSNLRPLRVIM